ncbi:MAG: hypothetical protein K0S08_1673 [Gammaproteobacteria bacterium]|jgi:hypothetical protein|nr:hypothetical protein [Gammaproteobacteria bacterium]
MITKLLALFDIDGCTFHQLRGYRDRSPKEIKDALITSNTKLLNVLKKAISTNKYQEVVIGSGTTRQSNHIDKYNLVRHQTPSSALAFPIFQNYLEPFFPKSKIWVDLFLMADIYGQGEKQDCPAGTSYKAMLREQYQKTQEEHNSYMLDAPKITLLYAYMHRFATLHCPSTVSVASSAAACSIIPETNEEEVKLTVQFYDDLLSILSSLGNFYTKNTHLIPQNITLELYHYEGKDISLITSIKGSGTIDTRYAWTVRFLYTKHFKFDSNIGELWRYQRNCNHTADELQKFHNAALYGAYGKSSIFINSFENWDCKPLDNFHQQEIFNLPEHRQLWATTDAYTTAAQLVRDNLFPLEALENISQQRPLASIIKHFRKPAQGATVHTPLLPKENEYEEDKSFPPCCVML